MKISRDWLQTFFDTTLPPGRQALPEARDIGHALTFHAFEIESIERHQDDDVLDVKVTPNRGHDCLSHRSIAKEISAILDISLGEKCGLRKSVFLEPKADTVSITIEDANLCSRYIAGYIKGVKVGQSPNWLVKRLHTMGQQSVNNVVDATNFVMFNIGQPLHAFDAGKLIHRGLTSDSEVKPRYSIQVRQARAGERMMALDEKEYTLTGSMLVIADGNAKTAIGVAGIKGGKASGIDEATKDIILESANFNGVSVRRTAQALKLRTDASQRFEQVISPELAAFGMRAALELILQLAGGELVGFADEYPIKQEKKSVSVSVAHVNRLLGTSLSAGDVEDVFRRLDFEFAKSGGECIVTPPFERLDIIIPEDLVEEVGRIIGYDKVAAVELPPFPKTPEVNENFAASEQVRHELVTHGYSEVYTSVFADKGERAVSNKVGGEKQYLRASLIPGLADALTKNIYNKDLLGLTEVKIFEIGTVWKHGEEAVMVGMASETAKASERPLTEYLKRAAVYDTLPLSETERYQTFSRYPYIVRDIALWTQEGTQPDEILDVIRKHAGELLVRSELFDRFEKENKQSFAFRLVFQSFDRTLTDEDANERMESVSSALKSEGFEIR